MLFDDVYCIYKEFKIDYNDIGLLKQSIVEKEMKACRKLADFMELLLRMFFKPKEHEPSHIHAIIW